MDYATGTIVADECATGRLRGPAAGPLVLTVNQASYGGAGTGARLGCALAATPCGRILVGATLHGVAWIGIHDSADYLAAELRADYPRAVCVHDDPRVAPLAAQVAAALTGAAAALDLPMDIRATPFQLRVWRELCAIPRGATSSYGALARRLGQPTAARAVGHANGANPTALVIPCHRVVGAGGNLTGYRWGIEYKRRLLAREALLASGAAGGLDHRAGFRLESREIIGMEISLRKS